MNSHSSSICKTSLCCLLPLLVFSSSLLFPTLSASYVRCHPDDRKALLAIKKSLSLHIPKDETPWNPKTDCCTWTYVDCSEETNRVRILNIYETNFHHIPAAVGDLAYLEKLIFHHLATKITGSIPYSITKLQNLKLLRIFNTTLSGPIPEFLTQLKNLEYLELSNNQLSGRIPASLANLNKLGGLDLGGNKLTGSIPNSFGRFNSQGGFFLYLSHNQLSGQIPKALGELNFTGIDLSYNKLVGDASMLFKENGAALWIHLSNNQLDFDLSAVRFPKGLMVLDLSHNRIRGSIPEQITELNWQGLYLSDNRLCGNIPYGGNVQQQGEHAFIHNRCLCGPPLSTKCK
ncbi:PREDICTED: polygalacturonase inhibitor-like [Nelumbo nucifera]|uniref:Polygalacturonase inhibitor-like n=2 Tax=Nelumbo nucifera TaxID=4432 RepID=A0A822Y7D4_NELNU|nr:PREDICTED: polygalacturonase inhibitor-like [Nelumbo nucifera]DAD29924.1 TPA_asm: hypothetical protein HUJ06_031392 [Nelumbo nucifera]